MSDMNDFLTLEGPRRQKSRPCSFLRGCSFIATLITVILLTILALNLFSRSGSCYQISLEPKPYKPQPNKPQPHKPQPHNCGKSRADAVSAGCRFDLISFSWLPSTCFDNELMQEFLNHSNWSWYTDDTGVESVPREIVEKGVDEDMYVTWDYHRVHCTYMWKKFQRAVLSGGHVEDYSGNYQHTVHCLDILLDRDQGLDNTNTVIKVKFPVCGTMEELGLNNSISTSQTEGHHHNHL